MDNKLKLFTRSCLIINYLALIQKIMYEESKITKSFEALQYFFVTHDMYHLLNAFFMVQTTNTLQHLDLFQTSLKYILTSFYKQIKQSYPINIDKKIYKELELTTFYKKIQEHYKPPFLDLSSYEIKQSKHEQNVELILQEKGVEWFPIHTLDLRINMFEKDYILPLTHIMDDTYYNILIQKNKDHKKIFSLLDVYFTYHLISLHSLTKKGELTYIEQITYGYITPEDIKEKKIRNLYEKAIDLIGSAFVPNDYKRKYYSLFPIEKDFQSLGLFQELQSLPNGVYSILPYDSIFFHNYCLQKINTFFEKNKFTLLYWYSLQEDIKDEEIMKFDFNPIEDDFIKMLQNHKHYKYSYLYKSDIGITYNIFLLSNDKNFSSSSSS